MATSGSGCDVLSPMLATPVDSALKPWACAPITALSSPPARPS